MLTVAMVVLKAIDFDKKCALCATNVQLAPITSNYAEIVIRFDLPGIFKSIKKIFKLIASYC